MKVSEEMLKQWRKELVFGINTMDEQGKRNEEGNSYMLWEDYWMQLRDSLHLITQSLDVYLDT